MHILSYSTLATACEIHHHNSNDGGISGLQTLHFTKPQMIKSSGGKSGDLGGQ
jgi:hypothetical protein